MLKTIPILAAILLAWTIPAKAQGEKKAPAPPAEKKEEAKPEAKPEAKKEAPAEVAAEAAPAIDDSEEVTFERLLGLYFEGRGGVFFTVGGARGYSNGQPFFGFELGYDINERLSAQFGYASGYQAANPLKYPEDCQALGEANCSDYHLDFGLTFFNLSADYDLVYGKRWALEGRLGGGIVLINPSAQPDSGSVDGNAFAGARFEYHTLLKHFTVGAECDFYYVFSNGIPALSVAVSVIYNF